MRAVTRFLRKGEVAELNIGDLLDPKAAKKKARARARSQKQRMLNKAQITPTKELGDEVGQVDEEQEEKGDQVPAEMKPKKKKSPMTRKIMSFDQSPLLNQVKSSSKWAPDSAYHTKQMVFSLNPFGLPMNEQIKSPHAFPNQKQLAEKQLHEQIQAQLQMQEKEQQRKIQEMKKGPVLQKKESESMENQRYNAKQLAKERYI